MKKRHHFFAYSALGIALCLSLIFGGYHAVGHVRAKDQLEISYTQRLLESREHLSAISLKLGKLPAAGENHTLIHLLSGVGVEAESLVSGLSSLPLAHAAMNDVISFCNQVSEYTLMLAEKLSSGQSLTEKERQTLASLLSQCRLLEGQFALAWNAMLEESLRLSGEESVFYQEAASDKRPLESAGSSSMEYPSMVYDGAFSDVRSTGKPKALGEKTITREEALHIASDFVGSSRVESVQQGADITGDLACYGVILTLRDGTVINAAVTRQGGEMLWMIPEHAEFGASLTLEECRKSAEYFLADHGYGSMEIIDYQVYDGLAVLNFTAVQDGVLLYPDLVKVQLRMDTGEVVGLESHHYLMNHTSRENITPVISADDALDAVGDRLTGKEARLCIIPWRRGERLCFEVKGEKDGQEYRIYLDAANGGEVEVHMMVDGADGPLSV